jgi:hypothetical protein
VPDHSTNLYVTLYGRAEGFTGLGKFNSDLTRMSNQFGLLNTKAQRQAALTEMALRKQATAATTAADVAVRSQGRIQAALATTSDRVERMQRRQTLITQQQIDLRQRAEQGFYDKNILRYTQLREKLKLQQEWITADLAKQLAKRDALVAASDDAQALSGAKASAKMAALQDVRNATGATAAANAGFGAQLGKFAMNPYVQGAAVTVGAGAYAAYKLSNYYAGFQGITQTTGANTNMSPAALKAYRGMLPGFRNKFPGSLADLNSAFFHALSLGFRGKGGMPNASTRDFVREVMLSALPSGANPGDVTNLLGGAINAYRNNRGVPKGAGPDWFMNVMHATGATGNMSVEELAQYFGPVMALAAASGSKNSLRQSGAMVDTLTQMGFTPQRANTNVAAIWQKLENAPSKAKNELAQLYRSTGGRVNLWGDFTQQGLQQKGAFGVIGDLRNALARGDITRQQILTLFPGTRGGQGMLSLLSQSGATRMATNYGLTSASSAQGQTQAQYNAWMGTRGGQTAERNALLGQAGLWAGQGANKEITDLTSDFNKATIAVGGFVKGNQALINGVGHSVGSLGAFAFHMNPLYAEFKTLNGVVGVTATLFRHGFVSALQDAGSRIKSAFLTPLGDLTNFIKPWGGKLVSLIGAGITKEIPGLKSGPLHATVVAIKNALGGLNAWAGHLGASIASGLGGQFNAHAPSWVKHALGISTGPSTRLPPHMNVSAAIIAANSTPKNYVVPGSMFGHYGSYSANYLSSGDVTMLKGASVGTTGNIMDTDFPSPVGTAVTLPGGKNARWKLLKIVDDKNVGRIEYWQAPNGGKVAMLHLETAKSMYRNQNLVLGALQTGKSYAGGTTVGYSGHPLTTAYGNNPGFDHLCIVTDASGRQYLAYLSGDQIAAAKSNGKKVQQVAKSLPTPPGQSTKATYAGALKAHATAFNYASLTQGVPVGLLEAVGIHESGLGSASNIYMGYMNASTYGNWSKQTSGAAKLLASYYNNPKSPAYHNWSVALEMYNAGPNGNAWKSDSAYAQAVLGIYAGLGHSTLGNVNGPNTAHTTPYANAIYGERRQLTALAAPWHGISVSKLPATGSGMYTQASYLKYEYQRDQLQRQIADNTAKQYALAHHMSPAWLQHMLVQDRATLNAQNKAARTSLAQKSAAASGAAGRSTPVHIIGRCAAEAAANVHRKKTADHTQAIARHTLTSAQILAKIYDHMAKHPSGGGRQGRDNPKVIGLHQNPMPGY